MPGGGRGCTSDILPVTELIASSHGTEKEGRPPHAQIAGSCPSWCDSINSLPCGAAHSTYWAWQMGNGENHHSQSTGPESHQPQALAHVRSAAHPDITEERRARPALIRHLVTPDWANGITQQSPALTPLSLASQGRSLGYSGLP